MKKKQLRHKQFLQLWYNRCGIKNKAVESHMEDIYNGLLTTIAEEVRLNGLSVNSWGEKLKRNLQRSSHEEVAALFWFYYKNGFSFICWGKLKFMRLFESSD